MAGQLKLSRAQYREPAYATAFKRTARSLVQFLTLCTAAGAYTMQV
jgi:hypothetical protein